MTTMSRIDFVGGNSDVLDIYYYFFLSRLYFITFFFFLWNAVHKFPVYGTIKCYCIVLYCKSVIFHKATKAAGQNRLWKFEAVECSKIKATGSGAASTAMAAPLFYFF